jgi:diamine N-acetyltransferase
MKADKKYSEVVLCYIEGNDIARKMYEDLGFYHTGEVDDDEIIMRKKL